MVHNPLKNDGYFSSLVVSTESILAASLHAMIDGCPKQGGGGGVRFSPLTTKICWLMTHFCEYI